MDKLIEINNLTTVAADDLNKYILKQLNLTVNTGEIHVIMGPNGAGKSTLAHTILASPKYIVNDGEIIFDKKNINELKTHERSKLGIFMSFQNAIELPGITVSDFIRSSMANFNNKPNLYEYIKTLKSLEKEISFPETYTHRDLNVGFSGGEKKKSEMLQLLMLNPRLVILDETDSGLDVDAIKTVVKAINKYHNKNNAIIIITHSMKMIEDLDIDYVHVLVDGKIVNTGSKSLAYEIEMNGFKKYVEE